MSRVPFDSPISLLTTLLILLVVCSASVENRATSPAHSPSHKKPPFNGSMFGKRSDLPPLIRASYASKAQDLIGGSNLETGDEGFIGPSAVETLALEMVRQEPLIKASVDQCLQLQRSLGKCCKKLNC